MHSVQRTLAAVAFAAIATAGVAHADWRPDAWITTKAKIALMTTEGVSSTAINVDTVDGRVTLHGKVESAGEVSKAEAAVKQIDGVREVRSLLQVVPADRAAAVAVKDSDLQERVQKTLAADKALADSSIKVASVSNGVVLLSGKASLNDHLRAITETREVTGVRGVKSEIESPNEVATETIHQYEDGKVATDRGVAATASDAYITSATKIRFLADSETPALDINVDTQDGVVTLFGVVPTDAVKTAAEAETRKVSGVKQVRNSLQVVPTSAQKTVAAKDDDIERQVNTAIDARGQLNSSDIDVEVKNGIVRLTGTVPTEDLRLAALITARSISGVRAVQNDLRIAS